MFHSYLGVSAGRVGEFYVLHLLPCPPANVAGIWTPLSLCQLGSYHRVTTWSLPTVLAQCGFVTPTSWLPSWPLTVSVSLSSSFDILEGLPDLILQPLSYVSISAVSFHPWGHSYRLLPFSIAF